MPQILRQICYNYYTNKNYEQIVPRIQNKHHQCGCSPQNGKHKYHKKKYYATADTILMDGRSFFINTNIPWFVSSEEKSKHESLELCTHIHN